MQNRGHYKSSDIILVHYLDRSGWVHKILEPKKIMRNKLQITNIEKVNLWGQNNQAITFSTNVVRRVIDSKEDHAKDRKETIFEWDIDKD